MNHINKTLYIPLYGKAYVSKKGIILKDITAEKVWDLEGFQLKGKAKSKWLAYYMGMRSAVFDQWTKSQMRQLPNAIIIHIGCGMDSRVERISNSDHIWYDVDFPEVIKERLNYFSDKENYRMIGSDVRDEAWLKEIACDRPAIVIMEGVSMYLNTQELTGLFNMLSTSFIQVHLLMDCYTTFAAKATKYKNPINDVGVTIVHGIDDPKVLELATCFTFTKEFELTPDSMINELSGAERMIFKKVFAGRFSKKMYRLYEFYSKKDN